MFLSIRRINIGLSGLIAALCIASYVLYLVLNLNIAERYSEFIVGNVAWKADTKLQDLIAVPAFMAALLASGYLFFHSFRYFDGPSAGELAGTQSSQLLWWSVGPAMVLAALAGAGTIDAVLYMALLSGLLAFGVILAADRYFGLKISPLDTSIALICALLLALVPLEISLVAGRMPKALLGSVDTNALIGWLSLSLALMLGGVTLWRLASPRTLRDMLPLLALLSQIGLPAFYFSLYPSRLVAPGGSLFRYETGGALIPALSLIVALSVFDVVRRFLRHRARPETSLATLFSPLALFGLIVGLKLGATISPTIYSDDYHIGEFFLGKLVYSSGGLPYIDYFPAHGFLENDFPMLLAQFIHDGSASGWVDANRFSIALVALFAFLALYWFTGNLALAFVCILLLSGRIAFFFFAAVICLWLSPRLLASPSRWLAVWVISAPLVILGIPPQGLVLVAASGLIALWMTCALFTKPAARDFKLLAIAVIGTAAVLIATPIGPMLIGAVRYVLENGPVNQVAYGVPWEQSWGSPQSPGLPYETLRNGWIIACLLFTLIAYIGWRRNERIRLALPALVALAYCLLLIPYSMGRIDPGDLSRSGGITLFAFIILIPLVWWSAVPRNARPILVLGIAVMGSLLMPRSLSLNQVRAAAADRIHTARLVDGTRVGLYGVGTAAMNSTHRNRLRRLGSLLNEELQPSETYLDLTSRNAHYYYMNRRPPIPITAPYNIASASQQKRVVKALSDHPPRLALMEADNVIHDGGKLSLRNPMLYQFVVANYLPSYRNGFIVGDLRADVDLSSEPVKISIGVGTGGDGNSTRQEASTLVVDDPIAIRMMEVGDTIRLSDDKPRPIMTIDIDRSVVGIGSSNLPTPSKTKNFVWDVGPERRSAYRSALLERAFEQRDLQAIPVAWGRSEATLSRKMIKRHSIEEVSKTHDLRREAGRLRVVGSDPYITYDLTSQSISGKDAGLLRLEFRCEGQRAEPRLQIFWRKDGAPSSKEVDSLRLTAASGVLIVPLDSTHRWTSAEKLSEFRLDLDNPTACTAIQVTNMGLYSRVPE